MLSLPGERTRRATADRTSGGPANGSKLPVPRRDRWTRAACEQAPLQKGTQIYLVTGATGNVGSSVARQLREQDHGVRALVRDPARAASLPVGIELVTGDLDDPRSLSKAVQGIEAIFLMQVGSGTEQTKTMIAAARDAAVRRIVLLPVRRP